MKHLLDSPTTARWALWFLPVPVLGSLVVKGPVSQWGCIGLAFLLFAITMECSQRLISHSNRGDRTLALLLPALGLAALTAVALPLALSYPLHNLIFVVPVLVLVPKQIYDTYAQFSSVLAPVEPEQTVDALAGALDDGPLAWPSEHPDRAQTSVGRR